MGKVKRKKPFGRAGQSDATLLSASVRLAHVLARHRAATPVQMAADLGPALDELTGVLIFSDDAGEVEEGRRLRALLSGT